MPLFIGSIGLAFAYLALNLIINSRVILATDEEKRNLLGNKLIEAAYYPIGIGVALVAIGLSNTAILQTYIVVGVNLIFASVNLIIRGIPLKYPQQEHKTLSHYTRIVAFISMFLAAGLIIAAGVWAAMLL